MDVEELKREVLRFKDRLDAARGEIEADFDWYPYDSLSNFWHLSNLLTGENRNLFANLGGMRIADVGPADGEMTLFFSSMGAKIDAFDIPAASMNGMRGIRALSEHMNLPIGIEELNVDVDPLPQRNYDLVLFMGVIYHLKNPYLAMERLSEVAERALISTRITAFDGPEAEAANIEDKPLAYLLDLGESNGDWTNYWIFSTAGLKRLIHRTGWEVEDYYEVGPERSDPYTNAGNRRAFALLRRRKLEPIEEMGRRLWGIMPKPHAG